jgi:hypothetical protein
MPSCAAWSESGNDASSHLPPRVVDDDKWFFAQVEEYRDSRVRDQCYVDEVRSSTKARHADPCETERPARDRDIPCRHLGTN